VRVVASGCNAVTIAVSPRTLYARLQSPVRGTPCIMNRFTYEITVPTYDTYTSRIRYFASIRARHCTVRFINSDSLLAFSDHDESGKKERIYKKAEADYYSRDSLEQRLRHPDNRSSGKRKSSQHCGPPRTRFANPHRKLHVVRFSRLIHSILATALVLPSSLFSLARVIT